MDKTTENVMSFEQLLEKHRQSQHSQSAEKKELKQAVIQLLSSNFGMENILNELVDTGTCDMKSDVELGLDAFKSLTVEVLVKSLEDESTEAGVPVAITVSVKMANQLRSLISSETDRLLLTEKQRKQLEVVIAVAGVLTTKGNFNRNIFMNVMKQQVNLPIEVIWLLHSSSMVPLDLYITCNLSNPRDIAQLSSDIVKLCDLNDSDSRQRRINIIQDIMCYLIRQAYEMTEAEDRAAKGLRKVTSALLDSITKKFMSFEDNQHVFDICPYEVVMTAPPFVSAGILKKYATKQLLIILGKNPVIKVSSAFQQQDEWSFFKADKFITKSLPQLLSVFDTGEALNILRQMIESQEVNWKTLLTYTSCVLVCYKEAPQSVLKLIQNLIVNSLDTGQQDGLIAGFLLARQACNERTHIFPSYEQWFNSMFGDGGANLASTKKSFTFLMKFLTDIVPFELPKYLKAHLLRPPSVPAKCRPWLTDYITLVKTRLIDLKEPVEELGISGGGAKATSEKVLQQTQEEIERALQTFSKTGKVPANVMEASIFRKPYFVGHFLPALLTPRPLPDTPDTKMHFIEALRKVEKIPAALYDKYQKSCDKMTAQLLQGVFDGDDDDDDDDMEELLLSPWQQLQSSVTSFRDAVTSKEGHQKGLASYISVLSEKISFYLKQSLPADILEQSSVQTDDDPAVNLDLFIVNKDISKVIEELCCILSDIDNEWEVDRQCAEWRLQLFSMLTSHKLLWKSFCIRVLQSIYKEWPGLSGPNIKSVAVTLLYLLTYKDVLPLPAIKSNGFYSDYEEFICSALTPNCKHRMLFVLRFCYNYLCTTLTQFPDVNEQRQPFIPQSVIFMFTHLTQRLMPQLYQPTSTAGAQLSYLEDSWPEISRQLTELYNMDKLQLIIRQHQLSLRDWIKLELRINPASDYLESSARQSFLNSSVLCCYLSKPISEGGCNSNIFQCLSVLCSEWLDCEHEPVRSQPGMNLCTCSPLQNIGSNSKWIILLLIQRIASIASVEYTSVVHSPWLPKFLIEGIHSKKKTMLQCSDFVVDSFSLVLNLPAYLLLCNSPRHLSKQSLEGATELITLINDHWRHHLTNGVVLSLEATSHIVQSIMCLCPENSVLANYLLEKCPCILPAVVYHWQSLSHLTHLIQDDIPQTFCRLLKYPAKLQKDIESLEKKHVSFSDLCEIPEDKMWHLGLVICSKITNSPERMDQLSTLLFEWADSVQQPLTNQHPLLTSIQCLMATMSWHRLYNMDVDNSWSQLIQKMWKNAPYSLNCLIWTVLDNSSQLTDINSMWMVQPDTSRKLLPAVITRILIMMRSDDIAQTEGLLDCLIKLYVRCTQLYDTCTPGSSAQPEMDISQPLTVHDLRKLSILIQAVLSRSSHSEVARISQEILSACDPDIRRMVAMTLKT